MKFVLLVASLAGACYSPAAGDCVYRCGANPANACPSGLSCEQGFCRAEGASGACDLPDAAPSDSKGDDAGPDATRACLSLGDLAVSNVVANPTPVGIWTVSSSGTIYDTDAPNCTACPVGEVRTYTVEGTTAMARVVEQSIVKIDTGASLTVRGDLPLIVIADTITIDGDIHVSARNLDCGPPASAPAGAGGGGNGGQGGRGGGAAGPGGSARNTANLQPLGGGCDGTNMSPNDSTAGSLGGRGGGAIQLSAAQLTISTMGGIDAHGNGGGAGRNGTSSMPPRPSTGGAGGGAGGSILLEACSVAIASGARLCATGGGGGGGGLVDGMANPADGLPGNCVLGGGGGVSPDLSGSGGRGGAANDGANADTPTAPVNGGGGGGAAGRIHIHGPDVPGLISSTPSATVNPTN